MKLTKTCARFLRKNGGTLLTIGASVGVVLTAIETGKATIKARKAGGAEQRMCPSTA